MLSVTQALRRELAGARARALGHDLIDHVKVVSDTAAKLDEWDRRHASDGRPFENGGRYGHIGGSCFSVGVAPALPASTDAADTTVLRQIRANSVRQSVPRASAKGNQWAAGDTARSLPGHLSAHRPIGLAFRTL